MIMVGELEEEMMVGKRGGRERCQVYFVGAGPGDPELITLRGLRCIKEADLVLYTGSLVPKETVAEAKAGAMVIDSSGMTLEEIHEQILRAVSSGGMVARVHTGDPSLFGAVGEQMELLERDGIDYQVIPGVTAAFAAAASAKVSFTTPEATQTLIITRGAGKTPVPKDEALERLASHRCSLAIYLSAAMAGEVQEALLKGGYGPETLVVIGYRVGWKDGAVWETQLGKLSQEVMEKGIKRQAVFLVLPGQEKGKRSRLYHPSFSHGFRKSSKE